MAVLDDPAGWGNRIIGGLPPWPATSADLFACPAKPVGTEYHHRGKRAPNPGQADSLMRAARAECDRRTLENLVWLQVSALGAHPFQVDPPNSDHLNGHRPSLCCLGDDFLEFADGRNPQLGGSR